MQVHAFDKKELISSLEAVAGKNYTCPECLSHVRVRGGINRSRHFFHLRKNRSCRQSQKGLIHIKIQERIQSYFEGAEVEKAFPTIGRIADVAAPLSKIVYEVQYSPMSVEEAKRRIEDYASVGYTVVWILHDHTYNKLRRSPLEQFLRGYPCYYSNVNEKGEGSIYDQLDRFAAPAIVNLQIRRSLPKFKWPGQLQNRARTWPFFHEGDLLDRATRSQAPIRKKASFKEIYLGLLHMVLERTCR